MPLSLLAELNYLRGRVAELEKLLGLPPQRPITIPGVSLVGWKLLALFVKRPLVSRDFARDAIYGGLPESEQPQGLRSIDQNVCRLNRALKPYSIKIKSERGLGYFLELEARARLRILMEKEL